MAFGVFASMWLYPVVSWLAVIVCLLGVAGHVLLARGNSNRNLADNRKQAQEAMGQKTLKLEKPGRPQQPLPDSLPVKLGWAHWVAFALLFAGVAAMASAEVVRLVAGWPWNSDADPMIAGPGDQVSVYLPDEISSIKGRWVGKATVELLNAADLGLADRRMPAISNNESWGKLILGKGGTQTRQLWVGFSIPSDAKLAGKTMRMNINLDVKYPASTGLFGFKEEQRTFQHTAEFRLASPRAGLAYRILWWGGGAIGGGLILLTGYWLYRQAKKQKREGLPSRVIPLGEEDLPEVMPAD